MITYNKLFTNEYNADIPAPAAKFNAKIATIGDISIMPIGGINLLKGSK